MGTTTSCVVRWSTFSRRVHSSHLLFRGDPATSFVSVRTLSLVPCCASCAIKSSPLWPYVIETLIKAGEYSVVCDREMITLSDRATGKKDVSKLLIKSSRIEHMF